MAICNEVSLIAIGLVVGAIGILAARASGELLESFMMQITPVNSKLLSGWYLVLYHLLVLALLVAVLVVATVLLR